jgi:hydroxypyruvate reductase
LLKSNNLWQALPCAVHDHLIRPAPDAPHIPVAENHIIGSNHQSLEAIRTRAIAENWGAEISARWLVGDVAEACDVIMQTAQSASKEPRRCFIFGGETTVKLRGDGVGGRNQELALRVAMALAGHARDWVFLSGGTDGRDGPTHAAGGIVYGGTLARLRVQGRDPQAMLFKNDSHTALVAAGDALITGATGTNVADIQILLLE